MGGDVAVIVLVVFIGLPLLLLIGALVALFYGALWPALVCGLLLVGIGVLGVRTAMTTPIQLQPIPAITAVVGLIIALLSAGGLLS